MVLVLCMSCWLGTLSQLHLLNYSSLPLDIIVQIFLYCVYLAISKESKKFLAWLGFATSVISIWFLKSRWLSPSLPECVPTFVVCTTIANLVDVDIPVQATQLKLLIIFSKYSGKSYWYRNQLLAFWLLLQGHILCLKKKIELKLKIHFSSFCSLFSVFPIYFLFCWMVHFFWLVIWLSPSFCLLNREAVNCKYCEGIYKLQICRHFFLVTYASL